MSTTTHDTMEAIRAREQVATATTYAQQALARLQLALAADDPLVLLAQLELAADDVAGAAEYARRAAVLATRPSAATRPMSQSGAGDG